MATTTQTVQRALPYRVPAVWSPTAAYNIEADFAYVLGQLAGLQANVQTSAPSTTIVNVGGLSTRTPFVPEYVPDDAEASWMPGPPGPRGPAGASGSGGGGAALPFTPEYTPDDAPEGFLITATGPQGPQGATGATGPPGSGGGGMLVPFLPEYVPDDAPEFFTLPGPQGPQGPSGAVATTVGWGVQVSCVTGADFTETADGLITLLNTNNQSATISINGTTVAGVTSATNDTVAVPYSTGQTAHITVGGGAGLVATFTPFLGSTVWTAPVSVTLDTDVTELSAGLVLLHNSNNQGGTYALGGVSYAEVTTTTDDSCSVPYVNSSVMHITSTAGAGLTAKFYALPAGVIWTSPKALTLDVDFFENAHGLIVLYNSNAEGGQLALDGGEVGAVQSAAHDAAGLPYRASQNAHITSSGTTGLSAWFFGLPRASSDGGDFSTNVTSVTSGTPVVFAGTTGKLGTNTVNRLQLVGTGHPNGAVAAAVGYHYTDTNTGYEYIKLGGTSTAYGWYRVTLPGPPGGAGGWEMNPILSTIAAIGSATDFGALCRGISTQPLGTSGTVASSIFITIGTKRYVGMTSSAVSGTQGGVVTNGAATYFNLDDDLDLWIDLATGTDVTNIRIWFGITTQGLANTDTLASASTGGGLLFRFSTVAGDGGWVGYTAKGASGPTHVSATVAAIAASTAYRLRIRFVRQGTPTVFFSVNDGTEVAMTADLPATGAAYFLTMGIIPQTNLLKQIGWRKWGAVVGS